MHEVSLAVKSIDKTKFFAAAAALSDHQESFFDENVMDKTRRALYSELVAIAAESTGLDAADIASHLELIDSSPRNLQRSTTVCGACMSRQRFL